MDINKLNRIMDEKRIHFFCIHSIFISPKSVKILALKGLIITYFVSHFPLHNMNPTSQSYNLFIVSSYLFISNYRIRSPGYFWYTLYFVYIYFSAYITHKKIVLSFMESWKASIEVFPGIVKRPLLRVINEFAFRRNNTDACFYYY